MQGTPAKKLPVWILPNSGARPLAGRNMAAQGRAAGAKVKNDCLGYAWLILKTAVERLEGSKVVRFSYNSNRL
jgi:hypothetical protein